MRVVSATTTTRPTPARCCYRENANGDSSSTTSASTATSPARTSRRFRQPRTPLIQRPPPSAASSRTAGTCWTWSPSTPACATTPRASTAATASWPWRCGNQWSPRIGVIYDFTQQGRSKLFANYARYYESVPLDMVDRAVPRRAPASPRTASRRPTASRRRAAIPRDPAQRQRECRDPRNLAAGTTTDADPNQLLERAPAATRARWTRTSSRSPRTSSWSAASTRSSPTPAPASPTPTAT